MKDLPPTLVRDEGPGLCIGHLEVLPGREPTEGVRARPPAIVVELLKLRRASAIYKQQRAILGFPAFSTFATSDAFIIFATSADSIAICSFCCKILVLLLLPLLVLLVLLPILLLLLLLLLSLLLLLLLLIVLLLILLILARWLPCYFYCIS